MEGVIQRTSSQSQPLNSNNKVGVEKVRSPKPPLLPKPQLIKRDSRFQKVGELNKSSSSIVNNQEVGNWEKNEIAIKSTVKPVINLSLADGEKVNSKQVSVSPKPQLPPKSNALNALKSEIFVSNATLSLKSNLNCLKIPSVEKTPVKPPRSPQKKERKDEVEDCTVKKGLLDSSVLPKSVIIAKQKSSSLGRNVNVNWALDNFINDPEQLSEFCKQVENCSKHSHILKNNLHSPVISHTSKKKSQDDLDLKLSNVCAKRDYHLMKSHSLDNSSDHKNFVNGFQSPSCIGKQHSEDFRTSADIPKSFLHSYVSTFNQTKDPLGTDEKAVEKNEIFQSFLHKNREKPTPKLNNSLEQQDFVAAENVTCSLNSSKSCSGDGDQVDRFEASKKFGNSLRPSSSDITSFGKHFHWFGSFGKGGKKDAVKKGRCHSQFYTASTVVDEQSILREKNRTKSLPNIKKTRVLDITKSNEEPETPERIRISVEYPHSDSDEDKDSLNQVEITSDKDSSTLAYLKAKELMTSEEVFIDVLKLLNVDFRNYVQLRNFENKNSCIPNAEVNKILNHLSQLQSLNEDILEDLRKRIENWERNPKIADVIVKKGAFLKMYTTYIQNFESQTNYLDDCVVKYPKFGKIVREFEATDRCKKLSLKHYMLKPVQRIPQYRLLLNDYLKHLDESSPDYGDTLSALKIVCEVVDHANRNVAHGDKEGRLMHFQSLLSDFELIKPGRELIKDGPLEKICRKAIRDRYFILLNDCLLHTTYSKQYLKIHQELPLSGMKICYNDDGEYPPSFTVHSITKSFILCCKNEAECREWVETLQKTIDEHIKKQKTFLNVKIEENTSFKLGKEAPVWVQDSKVTMCQICTAEFTALFRRHHCRGCGKVVCRNCGSNHAPLQYRNFKPDRVCDQCFEILLNDYENSEDNLCQIFKEMLNLSDEGAQNEYLSVKAKFIKYTSASSLKKQKYIPPRLKEVPANDSESVISGWLYRKSRKSWKIFWYVLKDHVLYVYKASEDVLALDTIPVLGYELERPSVNYEDVDKKLVFSLVHPHQEPIIFRAESQTAAERWFDALTAATNLDCLTL